MNDIQLTHVRYCTCLLRLLGIARVYIDYYVLHVLTQITGHRAFLHRLLGTARVCTDY